MIWVVGEKGMLGQELCQLFLQKKISFVGTDRDVSILEPQTLREFAKRHSLDWIVNCSGYTAVDQAEDDKDVAYKINRDGVKNIAVLASELNIPVIHISTDYVFDGTSQIPLSEDAPTEPIGVYGQSKLAGEEILQNLCRKNFIVRTAWLYGQFGSNFVYTMIELMNKKDSLKVVDDQRGSPTWTRDLAQCIVVIIQADNEEYGLYHFSDEGYCSWYGFAEKIYQLGKDAGLVTNDCGLSPCSSDEFPTKAKRPAYSLLSKDKVKKTFFMSVPQWQESIELFLSHLSEGHL